MKQANTTPEIKWDTWNGVAVSDSVIQEWASDMVKALVTAGKTKDPKNWAKYSDTSFVTHCLSGDTIVHAYAWRTIEKWYVQLRVAKLSKSSPVSIQHEPPRAVKLTNTEWVNVICGLGWADTTESEDTTYSDLAQRIENQLT